MQSEFMSVVSDYQVESFDTELGSVSLEKMMSIQYSEEILQKNFNVIIKILKQLHQTHMEMQVEIKQNKDGLEKINQHHQQLQEKVQTNQLNELKHYEELQSKVDKLNQRIDIQDQQFIVINDTFQKQSQGIEQLWNNEKIVTMSLENQQQSQQALQDRLIKVENELENSQVNNNNEFIPLKTQIDSFNLKLSQIQQSIDEISKKTPTSKITRTFQTPRKKTTPKGGLEDSRIAIQQKLERNQQPEYITAEQKLEYNEEQNHKIADDSQDNRLKLEFKLEDNQITNQLQKLEEQQSQKSFELTNGGEDMGTQGNDLASIQKHLYYHDEELMRMGDFLQRIQNQEEETQKIWDKIESISGSEQIFQPQLDPAFFESIKNQMRNLQSQVDQMQTSMNLLGTTNGSQEIEGNQMNVILAEINKVRAQLDKYILTQDFKEEINNFKNQIKKVADMIPENGDRVRREMMLKLNHKLDTTEAIKIVNEINFMKEQIQQLQSLKNQNYGGKTNVSAQIDPQVLNKIREMADQIHNLENDLKTLRIQYNSHVSNNNNKISDIEKKLSNLQIDRIFMEMQTIREIAELAKKDVYIVVKKFKSDQGLKRIKEIRKSIDNLVSKDDIGSIIEKQLQNFKVEILNLVKEFEELIYGKVNVEDLSKVESNVLQKLEEVVSALIKQLANKSETKKALIYLESKLNQIFILLEGGETQKDGEGLFAKRPMLWSCASCDKDLDKYKGQLGDYRGWAIFPPKETNPERLGRFGVGFKNQQDKHRYVRDKLDKERDKYNSDLTNLNQQNATLTFQKTQGQEGFNNTDNAHRSNASMNDHLPKINQK